MQILKFLFGRSSNTDIKVVKKPEFKKLLVELKGILIDVRTSKEFLEDHIQNARNINLYDPAFKAKINSLDKSRPVFIYCRSGARSSRAAKKFIKAGFPKVYDLRGGFLAWQK